MNITWFMSDLHACGYVRGEVVAREINKGFSNHRMTCKTDILLSDYYGTNIMVFQRSVKQDVFQKMLVAKKMGIKTVYELDDDVFNIPPEFKQPFDFYKNPDVRNQIIQFLEHADAITCSTKPLAESIAGLCKNENIYIIENSLDVSVWEDAFASRMTDKRPCITIGWMASGSHVGDVPVVRDALEAIMAEFPMVRIHCVGWVGEDHLKMDKFKERIKIEGWVDISELPYTMANYDIGLAPLLDNQFNRCKSSIKVLQYAALGIPCVASPVYPYMGIKHGVDGMLATGNCYDGWYSAIRSLVANEQLRQSVGMNARKALLAGNDIRNNVTQWIENFSHILKQ